MAASTEEWSRNTAQPKVRDPRTRSAFATFRLATSAWKTKRQTRRALIRSGDPVSRNVSIEEM
jgi:uncharacterized protein YjiS (DUF1127 family)